MSSGLLIFLIAAGAVAFFVIGLSLTIIFKGHYMDSEIGENRHMKKRGDPVRRAADAGRRGEPARGVRVGRRVRRDGLRFLHGGGL
ncbi:hypothetical protein DW082_07730 [Alistipes sp. AF48-12]|uniref:hypothetical protein n=1 Tax=Alistipes sp. AF48-12 TaxID=2291998 RepID=UPI000E486C40|nr:hypothetical protein [Alistipes sp. AF48-12]RHO70481.1 hypothetical protein DW082_07730 [Alistipes sp. AF48-12]